MTKVNSNNINQS